MTPPRFETIEFGSTVCAVDPGGVLARDGGFYAVHPLFPPERCRTAVAMAREFFAQSEESKLTLAIGTSPPFRGYSQMRSERDWREQIHFGREEKQGAEGYHQLRGPNRWPADPGLRRVAEVLLADLEQAARDILQRLWCSAVDEHGHVLWKWIRYLPAGEAGPRPGVAAHVDFSWITLLLQEDGATGLEIRRPDGVWTPAAGRAGTLFVNPGEILEYMSMGRFLATPHRVLAGSKERISMPFFLNPALDTVLGPPLMGPGRVTERGEHVHRVFEEWPQPPIVFGEEEWRRKAEGMWCGKCCTPSEES